MTNNTAAIADTQARERASEIAQQSPAGNTYDVPSRVYVSWDGQNVRFWSATPPVDMPVTTYVVQSELDCILTGIENAIHCLALFSDRKNADNMTASFQALLAKHGRLE